MFFPERSDANGSDTLCLPCYGHMTRAKTKRLPAKRGVSLSQKVPSDVFFALLSVFEFCFDKLAVEACNVAE